MFIGRLLTLCLLAHGQTISSSTDLVVGPGVAYVPRYEAVFVQKSHLLIYDVNMVTYERTLADFERHIDKLTQFLSGEFVRHDILGFVRTAAVSLTQNARNMLSYEIKSLQEYRQAKGRENKQQNYVHLDSFGGGPSRPTNRVINITTPDMFGALVFVQYKTACEAIFTYYVNISNYTSNYEHYLVNHIYSEYDLLSSVVNLVYNALSSLKLEIERLKRELDVCYTGRLSNYIITPALLKAGFLSATGTSLPLSEKWSEEIYYQLSYVIVHKLQNGTFRLHVLLPSSVLPDVRFVLYSSHLWYFHERLAYPYTEYVYLAVSIQKTHFMPMHDLDNCVRIKDVVYCPVEREFHTRASPHCSSALFMADYTTVSELCQFRFVHKSPPLFLKIGAGLWLYNIIRSTDLTIECKRTSFTLNLPKEYHLLQLSDGCKGYDPIYHVELPASMVLRNTTSTIVGGPSPDDSIHRYFLYSRSNQKERESRFVYYIALIGLGLSAISLLLCLYIVVIIITSRASSSSPPSLPPSSPLPSPLPLTSMPSLPSLPPPSPPRLPKDNTFSSSSSTFTRPIYESFKSDNYLSMKKI